MFPFILLQPKSDVNTAPAGPPDGQGPAVEHVSSVARATEVRATAAMSDAVTCLQSRLNFCDVAVMRVFMGFFLIRQLAPDVMVCVGMGIFMPFLSIGFRVLSGYS